MRDVPHLRFPEFSGEWEEHTLSEYLEFKNGLNPDAKRIGNGLPFISVMDILSEGVINYDNIRGKVDATDKEIECFGVKDGDLLFQRSSETLEDVGRANVYMDNRIAIYGGFVIRGRKIGNYDPLFFKYLLATPLARKRTRRMGAGAQHFNIGQEGLSKISLYFPSIEEQRKIAGFLSLIDKRIATQNKIIEKLESLIKGLSQRLLSPKQGWTSYKLDELCQIKSGYSGIQVSFQTAYKVSRIETISNHCINMSRIGFVKEIPQEYKLRVGDILFSNINSVQYIGNTAFIDKDYGLYHGMNLLRIVPDSRMVFPRFIHLLLCSERLLRHFQSICNKAVSQASINQTSLGKTMMTIPSYKEQQHICCIIESVERKLDIETSLLKMLQYQKQYLLRQMFI